MLPNPEFTLVNPDRNPGSNQNDEQGGEELARQYESY
jgi:hypothetical protein